MWSNVTRRLQNMHDIKCKLIFPCLNFDTQPILFSNILSKFILMLKKADLQLFHGATYDGDVLDG